MYCKYCGRKIDDDSTFCSGCGAKLSIAIKADAPVRISKPIKKTPSQEDFDPTVKNILGQFSPFGKVVFIMLCALMVVWVAMLTFHIFYPELMGYLMTM